MNIRELTADTVVDGRYRVLSRIGSGGMADVYCAQDAQLGRKVALKLLYRRFAEDPEFVERFRREASSAAGLQHPNVVGIYDRGEWDGTYYIAMEYLEGRSLKQLLVEEGPLDPLHAIGITEQILLAARFAHHRGIIHRDFKPHNVIVDDEGRVKVTDFGIARAGASDMTETGSIMGTAQYLSPEQAQGHAVSAASDLYAIGILLYELLAGRVPFDGDSAVAVALKQVSELPVPPSAYNPAISPELDAVILRALEKDPAARYADADEFLAALEQVRVDLGGAAGPTAAYATAAAYDGAYAPEEPLEEEEEEEKRRPPWWVWALVVLAIAALGVGAYLLLSSDTKQVEVPKVVGLQQAAATTILRNQGFSARVERVRSDSPEGIVLRQDPQPQTKVDEGSEVTLTVSDGPGDGTVPDVQGQPRDEAEKRLKDAGFKVRVQTETSDSVSAGDATRTSPPSGSQLTKGSTVSLFISSGRGKTSVPSVIGQTQSAAESEITSAGLQVSVSEEESDQTPGTVIRQSPDGGTEVEKGTSVSIVVAKAPTQVTVPDVTGQDQSAAATELSGAGLTVVINEQEVATPGEDGVVLDQTPGGGTEVKKGARVTLTVGKFVVSGPDGGNLPGEGGTDTTGGTG